MESSDTVQQAEKEPGPEVTGDVRTYSTGKLIGVHLQLVAAWRAALTTPGTWSTSDGRPRASGSDCVAASVVDLLESRPDPLDIVRHAYRMRLAHNKTRGHQFPLARTMTFYLPPQPAEQLDTLLARAADVHHELVDEARSAALRLYPGSQALQQYLYVAGRLADRHLPVKVYKVPPGTVARMAIDRWRRRKPATVVAAAVAYAEKHHDQPHRARRDMGTTADWIADVANR